MQAKLSVKELLLNSLEQTPEFMLPEVLDFLQFLKMKHLQDNLEVSILSESSLQKDWLKPEDDEAWQDL
jgi:hypothetical protein